MRVALASVRAHRWARVAELARRWGQELVSAQPLLALPPSVALAEMWVARMWVRMLQAVGSLVALQLALQPAWAAQLPLPRVWPLAAAALMLRQVFASAQA